MEAQDLPVVESLAQAYYFSLTIMVHIMFGPSCHLEVKLEQPGLAYFHSNTYSHIA